MTRESRPPLEGTCPAVAYEGKLSSMAFRCDLRPGHDGRHECRPAPDTTVTWPADIEITIAPLRPAARPHPHSQHPAGDWLYTCCACSGLYDPGCPACQEAR